MSRAREIYPDVELCSGFRISIFVSLPHQSPSSLHALPFILLSLPFPPFPPLPLLLHFPLHSPPPSSSRLSPLLSFTRRPFFFFSPLPSSLLSLLFLSSLLFSSSFTPLIPFPPSLTSPPSTALPSLLLAPSPLPLPSCYSISPHGPPYLTLRSSYLFSILPYLSAFQSLSIPLSSLSLCPFIPPPVFSPPFPLTYSPIPPPSISPLLLLTPSHTLHFLPHVSPPSPPPSPPPISPFPPPLPPPSASLRLLSPPPPPPPSTHSPPSPSATPSPSPPRPPSAASPSLLPSPPPRPPSPSATPSPLPPPPSAASPSLLLPPPPLPPPLPLRNSFHPPLRPPSAPPSAASPSPENVFASPYHLTEVLGVSLSLAPTES
ncbi:hypothetical protein C7M84_022880 [Penaeus vannamei]|uniref:Uncharacterized protein n=1 Tax=Penaeus vannamei TaxID=6689 RepID=A0A423UBC4_PENVA|nr:hypothetical protein C7M84_022880 [Penaeus vannamei]